MRFDKLKYMIKSKKVASNNHFSDSLHVSRRCCISCAATAYTRSPRLRGTFRMYDLQD